DQKHNTQAAAKQVCMQTQTLRTRTQWPVEHVAQNKPNHNSQNPRYHRQTADNISKQPSNKGPKHATDQINSIDKCGSTVSLTVAKFSLTLEGA
ncbi:MAG: hypothetical protein ACKPKO_21375, partial [Candidatus Fonsibacter sp.]